MNESLKTTAFARKLKDGRVLIIAIGDFDSEIEEDARVSVEIVALKVAPTKEFRGESASSILKKGW